MSNVFEGKGVPLLKINGTTYRLPAPNGETREGIKAFDFIETKKSTYYSMGSLLVEVGKKWQFKAYLSWKSANKTLLRTLQLAATQATCELTLNADKSNIKFNVVVRSPQYRFMAGLHGLYSISVQMDGSDLLSEPGYGDLDYAGYGLDFGNQQEGQSP